MNRIKQFFLSFFSQMNYDDIKFINIYLDEFEKNIFFKLKKNEQKHSIRVARLAIMVLEENKKYKQANADRIVRAALLHDIGKSLKKINVMQKVLMVLANKRFGEKMRKMDRFDFIDSYYNHGELSYNMLRDHVKDPKILFLIRNHHSKIEGDLELDLLRYCDDKN